MCATQSAVAAPLGRARRQVRADDAVAVTRGLLGGQRGLQRGDDRPRGVLPAALTPVRMRRLIGRASAARQRSGTWVASDAAMLANSWASDGGTPGSWPISRSDAACSACSSCARHDRTVRRPRRPAGVGRSGRRAWLAARLDEPRPELGQVVRRARRSTARQRRHADVRGPAAGAAGARRPA